MIPDRLYFVYALFILQGLLVQCRKGSNIKPHEIDENILMQRCKLFCFFQEDCTCGNYVEELSKKPGHCPNSTNSILEKICLDDCKEGDNRECPGTKVCCRQDCGCSCQDAIGLDDDLNLPPIPFNISVSKKRCNAKSCEISWEIKNVEGEHILYAVEMRSHVGIVFSHRKLGPWQWINFHRVGEIKDGQRMIKRTVASIKVKMGSWYQIRVAAISKYGFRGYSDYSPQFHLTDQNHVVEPKQPRKPKNIEVYPVGYWENDTVVAKVTWSTPKSDLPIDRYKVIWSLYLNDNNSLYMKYDYVKEPKTSYELTNLRQDSIYCVQVQAIATMGGKRLKSEKATLFLNTTTDKLLTISTTPKLTTTDTEFNESFIEDETEIGCQFLPNRKYGMLVRVYSNSSFNGSFVELCSGMNDCETKEYGAVRPHKDQIIFSKLKFNTEYTLRVYYRSTVRRREIIKTFTTPKCEKFKKEHPNLSIKC